MASTITYESALATLQTMFPMCEKSIIVLVLQQNRGHMENTVEHLMQLTSGGGAGGGGGGGGGSSAKPKPKPAQLPAAPAPQASAQPGGGAKPKPAAMERQPSQKSPEGASSHAAPQVSGSGGQQQQSSSSSSSSSGITFQRQPSNPQAEVKMAIPASSGAALSGGGGAGAPQMALPVYQPNFSLTGGLPEDFLRPPSYFRQTQASQVDRDAQLAMELQHQQYQQPVAGAGGAPGGMPMAIPLSSAQMQHHQQLAHAQQIAAQRAHASNRMQNRVASDAEIAAAAGGDSALAAYRAQQAAASQQAAAAGSGDDEEATPKARRGEYEAL